MNIKRVIFVENISDIDFQNVGLHWTANMDYTHNGGGQHGFSSGKFRVEFFAEDVTVSINDEATAESNANFPKEKEVVLDTNQEFSCMVSVMDDEEGYEVSFEEMTINCGTRCDAWVLSL